MKFKVIFLHFKTICIHKFWVAYYCFKFGLYWQGIIHDLSKFSLTEFKESIKYYTGTSSPIDACKKDKGYSEAWLHHKGRNKHHYEYWQDNFDSGTTHLEIPFKYCLEMICDFLAAGRTYDKNNFLYQNEYTWWENVKDSKKAMTDKTKIIIEYALNHLAIDEVGNRKTNFKALKEALKNIYDRIWS